MKIPDKRRILDNNLIYYLELYLIFCKYINVEINKIIFFCFVSLLLSGCFQSTAMIGPAITLASTGGNIYHAGMSYGTNKAVEKETGMTTTEYISTVIEEAKEKKEKKENKKFNKKLIFLVKSNIEKTRKILLNKPKKISQ